MDLNPAAENMETPDARVPAPASAASASETGLRPGRVYRRKTDEVLDAAEQAFLEAGYATTSMDAIAERAGVSKRTVYSNFGSKEDLFAEVIRRRCALVVPDPVDLDEVRDRDPEDVLIDLSTRFLTNIYARTQVQLYQTVVAEARLFPSIGRAMFEGPILGSQAVFDRYLRDQARHGRLVFPDIDLAAAQLVALLKTNVHMRLLFSQPVSLDGARIAELATASVRLFLGGARARPRAHAPPAPRPAAPSDG